MSTEALTHEEFLARRRELRRIGSSDAAAVCEVSRPEWGCPLSVYLDKLGLLPRSPTAPKRWGLLLENTIATAYAEETGREVVLPSATEEQFLLSDIYPWAAASPDRYAYLTPEDRIILELKTASDSHGWGEPQSDEVPLYYYVQVQHQMACGAFTRADVAVLIRGSDFRWYTVPRNPAVIEWMMDLERQLYDRIQRRDPPPVDWNHQRTPELLDLLHRPNTTRTIPAGPVTALLVDHYQSLGQQITLLEKERELTKAHLVAEMEDAGVCQLPDGRQIVRKTVERDGYTVAPSSYTTFRISKPKRR